MKKTTPRCNVRAGRSVKPPFMKRCYRLLFLLCCSCCFLFTKAQQGVYIPKNAKVYFKGDTATIFSDVQHKGHIRIGKKAVVQFKGKRWENGDSATIEAEENGGLIHFLTPDLPGTDGRQIMVGGYNAATKSGPAFARFSLANPYGLVLNETSFRVTHELIFENGHIYALDQLLSVGNETGPGIIKGYNEKSYVVTGGLTAGGLLLRENIAEKHGEIIFPIGSDVEHYTPAAIRSVSSIPDDVYAKTWMGVFAHLNTGNNLDGMSVKNIWQLGKLRRPGSGVVGVRLQHLLKEEGAAGFVPNRTSSYISLFNGNTWDTSGQQHNPVSPAVLTSGGVLYNSGVNERVFTDEIGTASYLTKFALPSKDTVSFRTRFRFWGYRRNAQQAELNWTTEPEYNIRHFVLQRRLANETDFKTVATVRSRAIGGSSTSLLKYIHNDPNTYQGISYYRLILVDYNGLEVYSNIVPIGPVPGGYGIVVWPNPAAQRFFVGISGVAPVKAIVVWNVIGQKVKEEMVNGRNIIPLEIRTPGTYLVGSITFGGRVIETKKVIITGN